MAIMGSYDRRVNCLRIASTQLKRQSKDEKSPTARELITYAQTLDTWVYTGNVPDEEGDD